MEYVGYIRVSTEKQGRSGLGLEAQRAILAGYAQKGGGAVAAEFTEVESGRRADRPELRRAIAEARERGAVLLVAKLDRLSRNVRFLAELMESRVAFQCCDLPECDNFTIHLFAALAQKEAELISSRTKAALAVKKAQGHRLGSPHNLKPEHSVKGGMARRERALADENNRRATMVIRLLKGSGHSLRQIAAQLNAEGFVTSTGGPFSSGAVHLLWKRAQECAGT